MKPAVLRQTYWPTDTPEMHADKLHRLEMILAMPDKALCVEVKRHVKSRSREAENYLWGVCYPLMSDASGYEKVEIHDAMCRRYFGTTTTKVMGTQIERPLRTTTTNEHGERDVLSAGDYWDFTDFVIREAAVWYDIAIPEPDPEKRRN